MSYDRRPGRASALTARVAAVAAVAYPDSPLPRAVVTGAPLRRHILAVDRGRDRGPARAALGLPDDRFVVVVTGGSQGSAALNAAVGRLRRRPRRRPRPGPAPGGRRPLPRPGPGAARRRRRAAPPGGRLRDHVERLYAAADLLVGRGGASTVAEAAVTGTPSILVPWAGAAEDHQTLNVRWLADQGGAVLLPEPEVARLGTVIAGLRADPAALAAMALPHRAGERRAARRSTACTAGRGDRSPTLVEDVARQRSLGRDSLGSRDMPGHAAVAPPSLAGTVTALPPLEAPRAPLDLSRPPAPARRRRRAARACRPSPSPSPRWATPCRAATSATSPCSTASGPPASTCASATTPPSSTGCDAVTSSTAIPAHNIELAAARELGIPTLRRAGMLASICAQARSIGVAGTHGKTTTTSMLMLILAAAGLGAELHRRRRRDRRRHRRPLDGRRAARRRGRRERRHAPRAAARRHDPAQRRARLPPALRDVRRPAAELRPLRRPHRRPEGAVRRRRRVRRPGGTARRHRPTASPRAPTCAPSTCESHDGSFSFAVERRTDDGP